MPAAAVKPALRMDTESIWVKACAAGLASFALYPASKALDRSGILLALAVG